MYQFDVDVRSAKMPRSAYVQKNRYCINTNLTEMQVEALIWFFLNGISASATRTKLIANKVKPVSTKTINVFFRMFGDFLFRHALEPELFEQSPLMAVMKHENTERYGFLINQGIQRLFEFDGNSDEAVFILDPENNFQCSVPGFVAEIFQEFCAVRRGIKSSGRGDLALATFLVRARSKAPSTASGHETVLAAFSVLKTHIAKSPLSLQDRG